jgi:NAD(P)-dependent dehydrogenase (short-subunit alcohol dehydrogenase family)
MKAVPSSTPVALVTGSSQGLGRAIALRLGREGYRVAIVASRSVTKAQAVVDEINRSGPGKAAAFVCNVATATAVEQLVHEVYMSYGRTDLLVNCAGVDFKASLESTREEDYDRVLDTNLKGAFFAIRAVAPLMASGGGGSIINISSVLGRTPMGERPLYCASKAALSMMTRALAWELAPRGIRINSIAPGNVVTDERASLLRDPQYAPLLAAYRRMVPSGREAAQADEIAGLVLFLASDAAIGMHGAELAYDDGLSCGLGPAPAGDGQPDSIPSQ